MSSRNFQRFQFISLGFSLFLVLAWVIIVYLVSPLRDPSFNLVCENSVKLIPWLSWVGIDDLLFTAKILAFALSSNVAFIFAQQIRYQVNIWFWLLRFIAIIGLWLILFVALEIMFLLYLLNQFFCI